jgi:hypothetical protein
MTLDGGKLARLRGGLASVLEVGAEPLPGGAAGRSVSAHGRPGAVGTPLEVLLPPPVTVAEPRLGSEDTLLGHVQGAIAPGWPTLAMPGHRHPPLGPSGRRVAAAVREVLARPRTGLR